MHAKGRCKSTPSSRGRAFQAPRHAAITGPPCRRLLRPPKARLPPQSPPCLTSAPRNLEVPEGLPRPESPRALARHPTASPVPPALLRGGTVEAAASCQHDTLPHGHPAPLAPCPTSTLPHEHPAPLAPCPSPGSLWGSSAANPTAKHQRFGERLPANGKLPQSSLGRTGTRVGISLNFALVVRWGNDRSCLHPHRAAPELRRRCPCVPGAGASTTLGAQTQTKQSLAEPGACSTSQDPHPAAAASRTGTEQQLALTRCRSPRHRRGLGQAQSGLRCHPGRSFPCRQQRCRG